MVGMRIGRAGGGVVRRGVAVGLTAAAVAFVGVLGGTSQTAAQPAPERGTLVVLNKAGADVWLIDVESGRHIATLPTGAGPHEVVVSSDGRWAVGTDYGAQSGGNSLTVIDVQNQSVARTVDLGRYTRPHGIQFMPGDSVVAVTVEASQAVVLVRVSDGEIVQVISTGQQGSHMLAVADAGRLIYTGDIGSNTVSELDVASGASARTFSVPQQPEAITAMPDGSEVWVGSNATGRVSVVTPANGAVETAAEGFSWPYRILISPDAQSVVIPDLRRNHVRFFDRGSREQVGEMDFAGAGPQGIIYGPDGRTIYLSLSAQNRIAVIDARERTVIRYIEGGDRPDGIAFSRLLLD